MMTQKPKKVLENSKNLFSRGRILVIILVSIIIATGIFDLIYHQNSIKRAFVTPIFTPTFISAKEILHGDTNKKQIIFTFDGGSGIQSGGKILEVLEKHHIKGTFFMTGKFVESNPEFVRKVELTGHEIFNHTYDHPHLPTLTDAEIISELDRMNATLVSVTSSTSSSVGVPIADAVVVPISSRPFFRAPYGDRDERVMDAAFKAGYHSVYWTVDAHDWEESTGVTSTEVITRIVSSLKPGNIYLMHIGDNITGNILDQVFTTIEEKGYKIVSLTEGL